MSIQVRTLVHELTPACLEEEELGFAVQVGTVVALEQFQHPLHTDQVVPVGVGGEQVPVLSVG